MEKLSEKQLLERYKLIESYHKKYLEPISIKLPHLIWKNKYTEKALTIICLSEGYPKTRPVSKDELTAFIKIYKPDAGNDIQAGRHLGMQDGWFILSGTRGDMPEYNIPSGSYQLISLEEGYPRFNPNRRGKTVTAAFWSQLLKDYDNRCACCGSKIREPHRYYPDIKTKIQKGHKNPNLPLTTDNIIPQCQICNRPDLNNWEYNDEGRVVKIAKAKVVDRCSEELKKEIYIRLYKHYKGKNPKDI